MLLPRLLTVAAILPTIFCLTACGSDNAKVKVESDNSGSEGSAAVDINLSNNSRFISGREISGDTAPPFVSIEITLSDGNTALCSGTIIGNGAVLTAAHCLENVAAISIIKTDGERIGVIETIIHPRYSVSSETDAIPYDVAVLRSAGALGLPGLSLLAGRQPAAGDTIEIQNFVANENGESGALRTGSMVLQEVTPHHLFAVSDNSSYSCNGDSGGAATYSISDEPGNYRVVALAGIASSGSPDDCSPGNPNLFINISNPAVLEFVIQLVPDVSLL